MAEQRRWRLEPVEIGTFRAYLVRLGNAVYRYRADDVPAFEGVVVERLKDHPEFLKLVPA